MKKRFFLLVTVAAVLGMSRKAIAQYPTVPEDVKEQSDAMLKAAWVHSDSAWQEAWPIIDNDARHGKPYVPWAARQRICRNLRSWPFRAPKAAERTVSAVTAAGYW